MSKIWVIGAAIGLVIIVGIIGGIIFLEKNTSLTSPLLPPGGTRIEVGKSTSYIDEAGFSFQYPESAKVSDITPQDNLHYSVLEITYSGEKGKITITVRDTERGDVEDWLEGDPSSPKLASLVGASSLGQIPAKQYSYSNGAQKMLLTVAVDSGLLYLIEGEKDSGFWEEVQNLIVSSFTLDQASQTSSGSATESIIYEEEEVVE